MIELRWRRIDALDQADLEGIFVQARTLHGARNGLYVLEFRQLASSLRHGQPISDWQAVPIGEPEDAGRG